MFMMPEETVKVVDWLWTCNFSKCKMAYGDAFSPYEVSWILDIEYMDGGKSKYVGSTNGQRALIEDSA